MGLKCRCIKGGACSTIGIYPATMVLQPCYKNKKSPYRTTQMVQMPMHRGIAGSEIVLKSHYHLTTISLPRQRLFFERFAFGCRRSVVWLGRLVRDCLPECQLTNIFSCLLKESGTKHFDYMAKSCKFVPENMAKSCKTFL